MQLLKVVRVKYLFLYVFPPSDEDLESDGGDPDRANPALELRLSSESLSSLFIMAGKSSKLEEDTMEIMAGSDEPQRLGGFRLTVERAPMLQCILVVGARLGEAVDLLWRLLFEGQDGPEPEAAGSAAREPSSSAAAPRLVAVTIRCSTGGPLGAVRTLQRELRVAAEDAGSDWAIWLFLAKEGNGDNESEDTRGDWDGLEVEDDGEEEDEEEKAGEEEEGNAQARPVMHRRHQSSTRSRAACTCVNCCARKSFRAA